MKLLTSIAAAAGAACVAATSSLGAQGTVTPAQPDSSCRTLSDGRVECRIIRGRRPGDSVRTRTFFRTDSAMMRRAVLGIELRPTGTRRDTLGVFVVAVTPKGPAETAGIIEGDRIAAINGVDVRSAAGDIDDPYTNGLASHRLSREVQKLTPGSRVTLRVYSGGRFRDVQVTAGRASDLMRQARGLNIIVPGGRYEGMEFELRERLKQMEPELRQRLQDLPGRIELNFPDGIRRIQPGRIRHSRPVLTV